MAETATFQVDAETLRIMGVEYPDSKDIGLLEAIIDNTRDPVNRLIFADSLEERGYVLGEVLRLEERAKALLGIEHVHGVVEVMKHMGGIFDVAELQAICQQFPSKEILEACKDTHVLCVVDGKCSSVVDIHALYKERFNNNQNAPWFSRDAEQPWSSAPIAFPFLLLRKDIVAHSWNKTIEQQQANVIQACPGERLCLPQEFVYAAILHQLETNGHLCQSRWIRFPVQTAEGYWVHAYWHGGRLCVYDWGGQADDGLGSCSVRVLPSGNVEH